ncbi:hypothetical protein [Burkholderia sp. BCC1993]|uniref:hypothetical protein n=1 Tax=Burkholderia sp. BCC1993 TaxID=2817444 RepID=UPI002AB2B8AE|nr:hypothetical protein [Burkholderia sp. BCC1993]
MPWPYPLTFLLLDCRNVRPNRLESIVLALTWTVPAQAFVAVVTGTMLPIASVILVAVLAMIVRRASDSTPRRAGHPAPAQTTHQ